MLFYTPDYYNKFRCIADKCTDNCCIGWEIEVDSDTAEYYRSVQGEFGHRLNENISDSDTFILKGERCPFLNENNLCDIIINCGEEHLCQICRDHPRFFNWYGDVKEGGIGLSCEEGARLILESDSVSFCKGEVQEEPEEVDGELFDFLCCCREEIFALIDRGLAVGELFSAVLDYADKIQFLLDNPHLSQDDYEAVHEENAKVKLTELITFFSDTEPIDDSWTHQIQQLMQNENSVCVSAVSERYMKNIFRYFIYRYFLTGVFDGEILSKVKLAAVSAIFINIMTGECDELSCWIEKSKLYSKQMEYSDENRELFYDMSYEKQCLSVAGIKKLVNNE